MTDLFQAASRIFSIGSLSLVSYVVAWVGFSTLLILANKWVLTTGGFPFPILLSSMGLLFTSLVSTSLVQAGFQETKQKMDVKTYVYRVLPIGIAMASSTGFGNAAFLYNTVSFNEMLKSLTPFWTMLLFFVFKLDKPTLPLVGSVCVIVCGTAYATSKELEFRMLGFIFSMCASVSEAVRMVLLQVLLAELKFAPLEGLMYMSPAVAGVLLIASGIKERAGLLAYGLSRFALTPWIFVGVSSLGFFVNFFAFKVISASSSLTLKVVGQFKQALVILMGSLLMNNQVSGQQLLGYSVSVAGFAWYNYVKMSNPAPALPTTTPAPAPAPAPNPAKP